MATKLQVRRDTLDQWITVNPRLSEGEIGFVIDTNKIKIGDGIHRWNDLPYIVADTTLIEQLSEKVALLVDKVEEKADASTVYTKDEAEDKFIDMDELDSKAQYIITEILRKVYTKEEAEAIFAEDSQIGFLKTSLEDKIDSLEDVYAKKVNVYTKSESDALLDSKLSLTNVKAGKGIYLTQDDDKNLVINAGGSFIGEYVSSILKDSDDISFTEDADGNITANLNKEYATKDEVDDIKKELSEDVKTELESVKTEISDNIKVELDKVVEIADSNKEQIENLKESTYNKEEADDKFATKDDLKEVKDELFDEVKVELEDTNAIAVSNKSEIEKIKEVVDITKPVVQLSENVYANLQDGDMIVWDQKNTTWKPQPLATVHYIDD
jgi:hypothetical protein